jgi:hypothetical protein
MALQNKPPLQYNIVRLPAQAKSGVLSNIAVTQNAQAHRHPALTANTAMKSSGGSMQPQSIGK